MRKKMMMLGVGVVFLSMTTLAFAEDVYITKRGKKYHEVSCPFIESAIQNNKAQKISKEEAVKQGRVACSKCFSEDGASAKPKELEQKNFSASTQK